MDGRPHHRNKTALSNFSIRISVNGASAVPTTRALNLDVFSSRVAKAAELATRKMFETFRKFAVAMKKRMMSRFSELIFFNSNKLYIAGFQCHAIQNRSK